MKTTRIATAICWSLSALLFMGLALWILIASPIALPNLSLSIGGYESLRGSFQPVGEYSVSAFDVSSIKIAWIAGHVTVRPHDADIILIKELAQRELNEDETLSWRVSDGNLVIGFLEKSAFRFRMPSKRLEVYIPSDMGDRLGILEITSTSGGIAVSDISPKVFQSEMTSGNINITRVQSESITIRTTSGRIDVEESKSRTVDSRATSGRQRVSGAFGDVHLSGTSGSITLENESVASTVKTSLTSGTQNLSGSFSGVEVKSTSGSISISSAAVPEDLSVSNTSGSVKIEIPNEGAISLAHSSTSGRLTSDITYLTQKGPAQFRISTTSGSVRITEISS